MSLHLPIIQLKNSPVQRHSYFISSASCHHPTNGIILVQVSNITPFHLKHVSMDLYNIRMDLYKYWSLKCNHITIITQMNVNSMMSSNTQLMSKFPQLSHKYFLMFGLHKSGSKHPYLHLFAITLKSLGISLLPHSSCCVFLAIY